MQLVINTFGTSLRRKGERFVVKSGDRRVAFSANKVQSIVITTGAHFSSDVVELASQHNVDIIFLSKQGQPFARVWQTRMGSTAAIRRRQLEVAETAEGLDVVRGWTCSKLDNQIGFLRQLQQRRKTRSDDFALPLATIGDCRSKIDALAGPVEEIRGSLMGWEGTAGRAYFDCLSRLMPAEYGFRGRSRRPAVDPFNAMLNYAYGVLYSLVERSLILAGLDPFVGFLHTDNYNKRSLVFDMIEPFRIIAERATVLIFTGRRAKREFFREVPGGIELAPEGRAYLITELNQRLDRTVRYPVGSARPADPRLTATPTACEPSDVAASDATQETATRSASEEIETRSVSEDESPSETRSVSEEKPPSVTTGARSASEGRSPSAPRSVSDQAAAPPDGSTATPKRKLKYRKIKQRVVIQYEAHALANALLGRKDIPKIVETKELWNEELKN